MREVEVQVMEERERLEERNEELEEEEEKGAKGAKGAKGKPTQAPGEKSGGDIEEGETSENATEMEDAKDRVLSEEEIDERCEALRAKLLRELEDEQQQGGSSSAPGPDRRKHRDRDQPPKERKQFKAYQVHELAEAKIQETERLRKALGIREDSETGEISSSSNGPRFGGGRG